jgi:hypothetical protein
MTDTETKPRQEYTLEEWRAEAAKRFGPVKDGNWSFVCPICGHIQSPTSIKASGYGDPNCAYDVCYGRETLADKTLAKKQAKKRGEKADCDWKAYGLFHGPVTVTTPDGKKCHTFDFAPTVAVVTQLAHATVSSTPTF